MNINATLIVQMLTFLVFVWFTMTFVWPPLIRALNKRRETIAEGLASADKGQKALEEARAQGERALAEAREQAASILRQAEVRAQAIVDQAVVQGRHQAEVLVAQAHQELDVQVKAAKRELYNEIAGLALKAAGQVVNEELDDAKHHKLVGDLVKGWG